MLIKLQNAVTGHDVFLEANLVWLITRNVNPLITDVHTTIAGPKGFMAFQVKESPQEVSNLIVAAQTGRPAGQVNN